MTPEAPISLPEILRTSRPVFSIASDVRGPLPAGRPLSKTQTSTAPSGPSGRPEIAFVGFVQRRTIVPPAAAAVSASTGIGARPRGTTSGPLRPQPGAVRSPRPMRSVATNLFITG